MLTIPSRLGYFCDQRRIKGYGSHDEYLSRIEKSLYYVKIPKSYCTSLPCTELAAEIFSEINKFSNNQLHLEKAASLSRNAGVSPCSLVLALLYLERLKATNPKYLTKVSPSELFLVTLMVGSKFLQYEGEENAMYNFEWAAYAGFDAQEVNKAEKQFLSAINWDVYVSEGEFWERFHILECKLGLREGCKRGWFTYTELDLLLGFIDLAKLVETFCSVTTACMTSYTAIMLTLLGSALLVGQIPGLGLRPATQRVDNQNGNNLTTIDLQESIHLENNIEDCFVIPSGIGSEDFRLGNDFKSYEEDEEEEEVEGEEEEEEEGGDSYVVDDVESAYCRKRSDLDLFLKLSSVELRDESFELVRDFADRSSLKFPFILGGIFGAGWTLRILCSWTWHQMI